MIKPKLGIFRDGQRVDIQTKDMTLYAHKPTLVYCIRLDFDGELREGRGVRKFRAGDYYCINQGGCRFITTARYVAYAYTKLNDPAPTINMLDAAKVWAKVIDGQMSADSFYGWLRKQGMVLKESE